MNFRQPYEQLIADKLRKLPAPDAGTSWLQMKRLLDNDEDTKGGGGKRPPGNNGAWWRTGLLAIVVGTGLWLYVEKIPDHSSTLARNSSTVSKTDPATEKDNTTAKKTTSTNNLQKTSIDQNTTLAGKNASTDATEQATNTSTALVNTPVTGKKATTVTPAKSNATATGDDLINPGTGSNKKGQPVNDFPSPPGAVPAINTGKDNTDHPEYAADNNRATASKKSKMTAIKNGVVAGNPDATDKIGLADAALHSATEKSPLPNSSGYTTKQPATKTSGHHQRVYTDNITAGRYQPVNETEAAEKWLEPFYRVKGTAPVSNPELVVGDSIETTRNTSNLLNSETKKIVAKAQRDKSLEDMTKKDNKKLHLDLSNLFKPFSLHMDAEPRWAAGIALNSNVPMDAQRRYNYSMNAKSGTLTDYIPSLYLQFHLNDYVYAQTEINFVSPQYTPQLLVYQQSNDLTAQGMAGISEQKSIYIQKLYYFSLPVSLHYSPVNNVYFSAGLQFSSFQSGLVAIQQKQYATSSGADHATSTSNTILKFKDDSIAAKLSPNEWRWQAGVDYNLNRLTFGMRYNRAFKNLMNVNLSPSLPATNIRNESLLFYVRFNLFESRKKGEK